MLATGAAPQALIAAGMCERRTPSGIALRGYVRNAAMVGRITALDVVWHRKLRPGYGWIFPCRDGVFNIGVGIAHSHNTLRNGRLGMKDVNLRAVFEAFTAVYAPARELMAGGTLLGELKGAPLRCTLEGARFSRPGLLVTGEAAGSTYSFTGEGIGKALETGIHAAEAVLAGRERRRDDAAVRADYEARLVALKPRFELYEKANRVNVHPWLADLVIWRAKKSPRVLARMSGVLNETSNPGNLVSFKGIRRLFIGIGDEERRDVPAARHELQHADRHPVQLHGLLDARGSSTRTASASPSSRAAACAASSTHRARAPRPWPRWCGATRSRATTSSRTSARPRRAASRSRTRTPSCASCGAATGCSRTTATCSASRRGCTPPSAPSATPTASAPSAGCCRS